ncbi:transcriptional regulator MntR [Thermaerobacter subterraneus]|uniref:Manganese transport regulator n=1 Tax=Thermaerobacter subterraneus DSM 13965 TaxID=867903 RepID=K6QCS9_9FIRM|nr:transcriptional regulator MntR [Thermaerobacter subterraneus]EKP94381.1 Mn-dependent transcriptional regulator [Thermaerobacter subterraneus DSM 13965]
MRPTPSMEDYLETIYELIRSKGYARVSDIALALNLQPSSVTRMVQRLDEQNFVTYERYRGLVLTERGEAIGRAMRQRHETLATFLRLLGVHDEEVVQQDVEGIEHHVSRQTLERIERFVAFARANPAWMNQLHAAMNTGGSAAGPGNAGGPPAGETAGGPDVPGSRGSGRPAWDGPARGSEAPAGLARHQAAGSGGDNGAGGEMAGGDEARGAARGPDARSQVAGPAGSTRPPRSGRNP